MASSLAFTVQFAATSFAFLRVVRAAGFLSPSWRVCAGPAGTVCPSEMPLEPLAGPEGLEDEQRLWCDR
jgi:hypothetical protein